MKLRKGKKVDSFVLFALVVAAIGVAAAVKLLKSAPAALDDFAEGFGKAAALAAGIGFAARWLFLRGALAMGMTALVPWAGAVAVAAGAVALIKSPGWYMAASTLGLPGGGAQTRAEGSKNCPPGTTELRYMDGTGVWRTHCSKA